MDSKTPNKPTNAVDNYTGISELNARYRHRETGVGYGKSSGYATERRYATTAPGHTIRVR